MSFINSFISLADLYTAYKAIEVQFYQGALPEEHPGHKSTAWTNTSVHGAFHFGGARRSREGGRERETWIVRDSERERDRLREEKNKKSSFNSMAIGLTC